MDLHFHWIVVKLKHCSQLAGLEFAIANVNSGIFTILIVVLDTYKYEL